MTKLFNPDEFCRTCRGKGGFREPSGHSYGAYVFTACDDCRGTGWRPGAEIKAEVQA